MFDSIKGNIKADALILFKSSLIRWAVIICILIISLVINTSNSIFSDNSEIGYYTNQLLITSSQFNIIFIILIGSYIGTCDFNWQTYSFRVINSRRTVVWISRVLLIFIVSILFILLNIFIGSFFDFLGGSIEFFSINLIFKYFVVIIVVFMWGMLAYFIGSISNSFVVASTFSLCFILLESFAVSSLPLSFSRLLPLWNQKSLLIHFFDVPEGAVAIVQMNSGFYLISLCYIILCIVLSLVLSYFLNIKVKYK
ncbi:MAG: hypothetical protein PHQ32_02930 [Firmicutes bacterium]|nr:hypothetical protein [Bacillota bacterium]